jgi:hypothetical protein
LTKKTKSVRETRGEQIGLKKGDKQPKGLACALHKKTLLRAKKKQKKNTGAKENQTNFFVFLLGDFFPFSTGVGQEMFFFFFFTDDGSFFSLVKSDFFFFLFFYLF